MADTGPDPVAAGYGGLFRGGDADSSVENDVKDDTMHIALRRNPADSGVILNGKKLETVTKIAIQADANNPPTVVLTLDPGLMMIASDVQPGFRFSHPEGYDPYNSAGNQCDI